jgi:hypothetical protein
VDLVEDNDAPQRAQRQLRVGEAGHIGGPLEIEQGAARDVGSELPGERRLADLPCPQEGDDGVACQQTANR